VDRDGVSGLIDAMVVCVDGCAIGVIVDNLICMNDLGIHLAIETSSRCGSIALGRGGRMIEVVELPEQQRHAIGLMPSVAGLFEKHGLKPGDLGVVSLSVGPGSFTGLRIAVTVAKMLARTTGCRIVAVPTLEVVAWNAKHLPDCPDHLAVCLNAKRDRVYTGLFRCEGEGEGGARVIRSSMAATLMRAEEIAERFPAPLLIFSDKLPEYDWPATITIADRDLATPHAGALWGLGEREIEAGVFADPYGLTPLYIREPEAEVVWAARAGMPGGG